MTCSDSASAQHADVPAPDQDHVGKGAPPVERAGVPAVVLRTDRWRAVMCDLDGVLTDTAALHQAAWKQLFDRYLSRLPGARHEDHRPFTGDDYRRHVDGKPRLDGVVDFLRSRGIQRPDTALGMRTAHELARCKDAALLRLLGERGVRPLPGAAELLESARRYGLGIAVVSASRNAGVVLAEAGLRDAADVLVDGVVSEQLGLAGKPDPATLLLASRELRCEPDRCVLVEDSEAGLTAARHGGFGLILGVGHEGEAERLRTVGADEVVADLTHVVVQGSVSPS